MTTDRNRSDGRTGTQTPPGESPHGSTVAYIRSELIETQLLIRDDDLRDRVEAWVQESYDVTEADTAAEYVGSRLNGLLAENDMYHSPEVRRGEDAFPADCEGCPHYGSSCPVLLDNNRVKARERRLTDADTERDAREVFQRQARETGCVVIPALLEEWEAKHSDMVREGHELLTEVSDLIHTTDENSENGGEV
ncbi:hypothetical protein C478_07317 [Natrinema thermotolerans DSM 11552]|nr:hypothetical protein C478_07317 [Natrinema thermotolerans DSM 11552]